MKLTADDLEQHLAKRAAEMRDFAHEHEHWIDVDAGESPTQKYPTELRYHMRLPNWETAIVWVYSLDLVRGRKMRHLSVQISVPGAVTLGQVREGSEELVAGLESAVRAFFPFNEQIGYQLSVAAPIPVVDKRAPRGEGNVHFRTPVTFHFTVDDGPAPERKIDPSTSLEARVARVLLRHLAAASLEARGDAEVRYALDELARDLLRRVPHAVATVELPPQPE